MEELNRNLEELNAALQGKMIELKTAQGKLDSFNLVLIDGEASGKIAAVKNKLVNQFEVEFVRLINQSKIFLVDSIDKNISKIDTLVSLRAYEDTNIEKYKNLRSEKAKDTMELSLLNHVKGTCNIILNI